MNRLFCSRRGTYQNWTLYFFLILTMTALAGCGTTALNMKPDSQVDLTRYKTLAIQSTVSEGVVLPDLTQSRIKDRIKAEIAGGCCPQRFEVIYTDPAHPADLVLSLQFTTYDEGNRFARAMLAGLGAMKINADVEIKDGISGSRICKGEAGKSFAWGGMVGAMTGIEDVERDFAKEVSRGFGEMLGIPEPAARAN